jgi:hypothetical protein
MHDLYFCIAATQPVQLRFDGRLIADQNRQNASVIDTHCIDGPGHYVGGGAIAAHRVHRNANGRIPVLESGRGRRVQ